MDGSVHVRFNRYTVFRWTLSSGAGEHRVLLLRRRLGKGENGLWRCGI